MKFHYQATFKNMFRITEHLKLSVGKMGTGFFQELYKEKRKWIHCAFTHNHKRSFRFVTLFYPPPVGKEGFCLAMILSCVWRFLWAQQLKNYWPFFFFNFNMTFLATWGCASDFLKMLPKFKMATRSQL